MKNDELIRDKRKTGLIGKFHVSRRDGRDRPGLKHHNCKLFVLDLTHDPHAIPAIKAYIESCEKEYPFLAMDLKKITGIWILESLQKARKHAVSNRSRALRNDWTTDQFWDRVVRDFDRQIEKHKKKYRL